MVYLGKADGAVRFFEICKYEQVNFKNFKVLTLCLAKVRRCQVGEQFVSSCLISTGEM